MNAQPVRTSQIYSNKDVNNKTLKKVIQLYDHCDDDDDDDLRLEVQPLVGNDIQRAKDFILNQPVRYKNQNISTNLRDYTMFCFNINIGLRIADLLNLKISKIVNANNEIVDTFLIREGKTKKRER